MKKTKFRTLVLISSIALTLSLSGCTFILKALEDLEDEEAEKVTPSSDADFDVDKVDVDGKTIIQKTYKDYGDGNLYPVDFCPTHGNVKLLIIPVWFYDSSTYIKESNKETIRNDIQKAYLGTNTGWHSVKTFYEEEAKLAEKSLTISGTVSSWYSTSYTVSDAGTSADVTTDIVKQATDWYFTNNPTDPRSNYDSDNNGYLDGVMIIYGAPDYGAMNKDSWSNLWAYCYWLQERNEGSNPIPNAYFWASYDFMYSSGIEALNKTGKTTYGGGDTTYCNIDAHTYIHEMGHVFGLDDYYDYGDNSYCPAGGFSMQDYNVGGHDPYSVMALGWANPYVVTNNSVVTIGAFQKTRELVLVTETWNGIGSPFDEYLLFELYTPTGLNEYDCTHDYKGTQGPNRVGIRLWHVDARLTYVTQTTYDDYGYEEAVYNENQMTTNPQDSRATYGVYHAFSNTYDNKDYGSPLGAKYYNHNLLQLIRNNVDKDYKPRSALSKNDLFTDGTYEINFYNKQFVKSSPLTMNNGSYADWKFKVTINGNGENSTAKIEIIK